MIYEERCTIMAREFDAKHGEPLRHEKRLFYADGAVRSVDPMGAYFDPVPNPNDPYQDKEILRNQIFYRQERLRRAVKEFSDYRQEQLQLVAWHQTNPQMEDPARNMEQHLAKLKELRQTVNSRKKSLDRLLEHKKRLEEPRIHPDNARYLAERQAETADRCSAYEVELKALQV